MLHFAKKPPARPALFSIRGGKPADQDATASVVSGCYDAGVRLYLDSDPDGAVRLQVRATAGISDELRKDIERHKQEIIVRLLASERYPKIGVPAMVRKKTAGQVWGRKSLEDHVRFVGSSRLLRLLQDGEVIVTADGVGDLVSVFGGVATVLLEVDRVRALVTAGNDDAVLKTREYPAGDIYPAVLAASRPDYVPIPTIGLELPAPTGTAGAPQPGVADIDTRRNRAAT